MTDILIRRKRRSIVRGGLSISVRPEQFCELAISRQKLSRVDDDESDLCGLHDVQTGKVFVVDAAELRNWLTRIN